MTRTRWECGAVVALVFLVCVLLWWGLTSSPRTVAARSTADDARLAGEELGGPLSASGTVGRSLRPGRAGVIEVRVANRGSEPVELSRLEVSIAGIDAPRATERRECEVEDFEVVQGDVDGVVVDGGVSLSLSQAGVPPDRWPRLRMIDREHNQDGCRGATLALVYDAEGVAS